VAAGANNRRHRGQLAVRTPRGAAGPQPAKASLLAPEGGAEPVPTGDAGGGGHRRLAAPRKTGGEHLASVGRRRRGRPPPRS